VDYVRYKLMTCTCYLLSGDENKLTLLNISTLVEHLLVLLLDEDNIIRRNACMVLASISRHGQFNPLAAVCLL